MQDVFDPGEFKGDVFLLIVQRHIAFSFSYLAMVALISLFQKILHCAAKDFGKAENRFRAGFIDILVVLLVHLDRPEADAASLGKLCLCAAVGRTDALEIGICKIRTHFGIGNIGKFADVCFVKRSVHLLQILERKDPENIAEFPAGKPLIVRDNPANPILSGTAERCLRFGSWRFAGRLDKSIFHDFNSAISCQIGRLTILDSLADRAYGNSFTKSFPEILQALMA